MHNLSKDLKRSLLEFTARIKKDHSEQLLGVQTSLNDYIEEFIQLHKTEDTQPILEEEEAKHDQQMENIDDIKEAQLNTKVTEEKADISEEATPLGKGTLSRSNTTNKEEGKQKKGTLIANPKSYTMKRLQDEKMIAASTSLIEQLHVKVQVRILLILMLYTILDRKSSHSERSWQSL